MIALTDSHAPYTKYQIVALPMLRRLSITALGVVAHDLCLALGKTQLLHE